MTSDNNKVTSPVQKEAPERVRVSGEWLAKELLWYEKYDPNDMVGQRDARLVTSRYKSLKELQQLRARQEYPLLKVDRKSGDIIRIDKPFSVDDVMDMIKMTSINFIQGGYQGSTVIGIDPEAIDKVRRILTTALETNQDKEG